MIEIKRSKKKIIDDFGSYRLEYTAINKDKSKNFIIYFYAKDDDFLEDSDFYEIITEDNQLINWKKNSSKFSGEIPNEILEINGIKELIRFLYDHKIEVKESIFDVNFSETSWINFMKSINLSYNNNKKLCKEIWEELCFLLSNNQLEIESYIKSLEKSTKLTKNKDYETELLIKLNYINRWVEHNEKSN